MTDRRFTWFSSLTDGASVEEACKLAGIDVDAFWVEMKNDCLTPTSVVYLAQAYGERPTVALAITGLIPKKELTTPLSPGDALKLLSDEELMLLTAERMQKDPAGMARAFKKSATESTEKKNR